MNNEDNESKRDKRLKIAIIAFIVTTILFLIGVGCLALIDNKEEEEENTKYYTYAIIFYPDHKTTIEGYVDKFIWSEDFVRITINDNVYISDPENVMIVKRKDLVVNKENSE